MSIASRLNHVVQAHGAMHYKFVEILMQNFKLSSYIGLACRDRTVILREGEWKVSGNKTSRAVYE